MRQSLPITRRAAAHRHAFTLLELMVAMMIVAVIAGTLAMSLSIGFRSRTQGEEDMANTRTTELVMESLRADFQSALPAPDNSVKNAMGGTFSGTDAQLDGIDADDVVFFTTAPSPYHVEGGNGEIKWIELTCCHPNFAPGVPSDSTDYVLVRRTRNNSLLQASNTAANGLANYDEEVLCRDVRGFNVQYFDGTVWQDTWPAGQTQPANALPLAIKIQLTVGTSKTDASGNLIPTTRIYQLPCSSLTSGTITSAAPAANGGGK